MPLFLVIITNFSGLLDALSSDPELRSLVFEDDCDLSFVLSKLDVRLTRALMRRINADGISTLSNDIYIG